MSYAFVQTSGRGGDVLREYLAAHWGLAAWEQRREDEHRPSDDVDLMRRLAFVWLHNNMRVGRAMGACARLAADGEKPPIISRLAAGWRLDHKRPLWELCGSTGWIPACLTPKQVQERRDEELVILKPSTGSCGRGVQVAVSGPAAAERVQGGLLGQQYITNPYLLFHHYKFDARVYVLLIRTHAGYQTHYHDGYLRRCAERYYHARPRAEGGGAESQLGVDSAGCDLEEADSGGVVSAFAHLSNWNMSRHHPRHDPNSDCVDGIPIRLPLTILGRGNIAAMRAKMQMAVRDVVARYEHAAWEEDGMGQFGLFGVDFLFDENLQCWMLEWNQGPGIRWSPPFLQKLHTNMLKGMLGLVFKANGWSTESVNEWGNWVRLK